jgi:hypothetical protein
MAEPDRISHEQAVELLPWLANDTLDADEVDAVKQHASSCVVCRHELAQLEALARALEPSSGSLRTPLPDMRNINARIDEFIEQKGRTRKQLSKLRDWFDNSWRLAFIAQSVIMVALVGGWLLTRPPEPSFSTLSTPQPLPNGHYLRVVFEPNLDASGLSELLQHNHLSIVQGPSERGVYTLRFDASLSPADREQITDGLTRNVDVLFAQPIASGAER